ncbi:MAG: DUF3794 domain-containing protein [Firmicutes bacterium]|nr:DUF3794 domain-containing protein [Bacillota bacterium]
MPNGMIEILANRIIGRGRKEVLLEKQVSLPEAVKVTKIAATLDVTRAVVVTRGVIVQGSVEKQIFFVGPDGLKHHAAEGAGSFSELVDIELVDPGTPVATGDEVQDHSRVENVVFALDESTGVLTQKVVILLDVVVTRPVQLHVVLDPNGILIKANVKVGSAETHKFFREETILPDATGIKIVRTRFEDVRCVVEGDNVIIQGTMVKLIGFETEDGETKTVEERVAVSNFVNFPGLHQLPGPITPTCSISAQNIGIEFSSVTGFLVTKFLLTFSAQVFQTQQVTVKEDPGGVLIKTPVVIGEAEKQKFISEEKTLDAIKIANVNAAFKKINWLIKDGKAIVQGIVNKQIFFVVEGDLIRHLGEEFSFSDLVDVPPVRPGDPVREGMGFQDESDIEQTIVELNPETRTLVQKIVLRLKVKVIDVREIRVAVAN